MNETVTMEEKSVKEKSPLAIMRERHGGMSDELKEYFKEQQRVRKLLKDALKTGEKTVPDLAEACGLEKPATLWHIMAMRRYGQVIESSERNGYPLYALKEEGK
jgi:hypothetical protein